MRRSIAWVFCVALLGALLLPGCGIYEKKALVGTWTGSVDLTQPLNDAIEPQLGELNQFYTFDSFVLECIVTFTGEGTYTVGFERSSVERAFEQIMADLEAGMYAYMEQILHDQGLDVTVEEYLEQGGNSIKRVMEQTLAAMDTEALIEELLETTAMEGNFDAEGGKLMLSDGLEYQPDPAVYHTYRLSGGTLTIEQGSAEGSQIDALFPLILKKAR